jgi:hypothetical protein
MAPPTPALLILHRVYRMWEATHRFSSPEVTIAWIAHALVRFDGGPPPDPGQLAPALRFLGYTPVRRRQGDRRVNAWLLPGRPPSPRGRPYRGEQRCAPETWPISRRWRPRPLGQAQP